MEKRFALYRPIISPNIPLPFGVRSVGHYRVACGCSEYSKRKPFIQLFWGVQGEGIFRYGDAEFRLGPKEVFIYFPGDIHELKAVSDCWEYRWLTLDGDSAVNVVRDFGLSRESRYAGSCPVELFESLGRSVVDISPFTQRENAALAFRIIGMCCGVRLADDGIRVPWFKDILRYIHDNYADSGLNVSVLAGKVGVHRATFSRIFRQKTGVVPVDYLISYRVQKALSLLRETHFTIKEVAARCGFDSPDYFCKVIKKSTGMSPKQFRYQ